MLNGDRLRVAKGHIGGPNTNHVYDENRGEPVVLFDGSYYVYGLGMTPIATVTPGGVYTYFHADALGSTRALTDGAGASLKGYDYDAYGAVRAQTMVPVANDWQYTGAQYDSETKNYNLHARNYDPQAGRFTSADPLGYGGGGNLYAYAGNNPTSATDRSGLCPICAGAAIGGAMRLRRLHVRGAARSVNYYPCLPLEAVGQEKLSLPPFGGASSPEPVTVATAPA